MNTHTYIHLISGEMFYLDGKVQLERFLSSVHIKLLVLVSGG